jgi:haloacetate dehalogenase
VFDGFDEFDIVTTGTTIHGRRGGSGPPVLLLHGLPETQLMWHREAPRLAEQFTVVATDLRGFGDSGRPPSIRPVRRGRTRPLDHHPVVTTAHDPCGPG